MAQGRGLKEVAAEIALFAATRDALFGDCKQVREQTAKALALTQSYGARRSVANVLAACGESGRTQAITDEMLQRYPKATLLRQLSLPLVQARAAAQTGDTARARKAYQDFFALWKDADPDIPDLREARREYEELR